jgi:carbohydrate kinase (thermoresistant glucokinase family)
MAEAPARPLVIVLMGVTGCGKTAVGRLLAGTLGWAFEEGDDYHSPDNVAKMRAGTPLDDADRLPWLRCLAGGIDEWMERGVPAVLTCSALKQRYRDILIGDRHGVALVHLKGPESLIRARLAARRGHYMPASLLASQFAALEEPEDAITIDVSGTPHQIVAETLARLGARENC